MITISMTLPDGIGDEEAATYRSNVVMALVASARAEITRLADQELVRLRGLYNQGVEMASPAEVQKTGVGWVQLQGKLANMLEQGAPGWDLRRTLLENNPKKRTGPKGTYAFIPFQHQIPGSLHSAMPANVYADAKKLKATVGAPGQATKWGDKLPAGMAPKAKPHHVTDLYAGMYRMAKTYAAAKQSTYRTFRTITSWKTEGWQHPGFRARGYFEKAAQYLEQYGQAIIATVPMPQPTTKEVKS